MQWVYRKTQAKFVISVGTLLCTAAAAHTSLHLASACNDYDGSAPFAHGIKFALANLLSSN